LGRYCWEYLNNDHACYAIGRADCDIQSFASIRSTMNKAVLFLKTQTTQTEAEKKQEIVVINCVGVVKQRHSVGAQDMYYVNSVFPYHLLQCCMELKLSMIHISTNCVFDGTKAQGQAYGEQDSPNEMHDDYGKSKRLGEILLESAHYCKLHILRTSIIGEEVSNKLSLLEWAKSQTNKTIQGYTNHYWNGVTCLELVRTIASFPDKTYYYMTHVHSQIPISKYDLLCCINQVYDLKCNIQPIQHKTASNHCLQSKHQQPILASYKWQLEELKAHGLKMRCSSKIQKCRGCASAKLYQCLDLGAMPHAGNFLWSAGQPEIAYV
jgi:dTDP-4-dehydrorhamnose reductase